MTGLNRYGWPDAIGTGGRITPECAGSNTFDLSGVALDQTDGRIDLIVLGYGTETAEDIGFNEIYDFGL